MKRRVALSLDADLLARADERRAALGQSRTVFVERALESALDFEDRLPRPPAPVGKHIPAEAFRGSSSAPTFSKPTAAMVRQAKLNEAKAGKR